VWDTVLGADTTSQFADSIVAVMAYTREEVVFDLGCEAEGRVVPEVGLASEINALGDLHFRPGACRTGGREYNHVSYLRAG